MLCQTRKRTEPEDIAYSLYLYFLGLSLRNTSKAVSRFVKRSHTAIRDWIQKYKPQMLSSRKIRVTEFIIDETIIKVGSEYIWLWIAIENDNREILQISISKERNMFVAERFISNLVKRYGEHPVSTDGGTWYPQACRFLRLQHHHIHSPYEKSIIERTVQYIKDRTEGFDDYFPCRKSKCKLQHIQKWLNLFVSHYNNNLFS
jgi:putative transposase